MLSTAAHLPLIVSLYWHRVSQDRSVCLQRRYEAEHSRQLRRQFRVGVARVMLLLMARDKDAGIDWRDSKRVQEKKRRRAKKRQERRMQRKQKQVSLSVSLSLSDSEPDSEPDSDSL